MKCVITEHADFLIGYMDFTNDTPMLREYMKEIYTWPGAMGNINKPLYVYFKNLTLIVSSNETLYRHTLKPSLPTPEQLPDHYLFIKIEDPTDESIGMAISKNRMGDKTKKQLSDALIRYNDIKRQIFIPFEVLGV